MKLSNLFKVSLILLLFIGVQSCATRKKSTPKPPETTVEKKENLHNEKDESFVFFINEQHQWVDSIFETLTPRERIAQLLMVRAHSNLGQEYIDSVGKVIQEEKLGGVVVFQGTAKKHVKMLNDYQALSEVPLLVSVDAEWGLGMRLINSSISYPYQIALGAVRDNELIYKMGVEIAKDLKRVGIHYNFAPDVDINNNPKNPVIGYRSFGDDKYNVTEKAGAYVDGMLTEKILSSIKHFPGHGDTDVDSHADLPVLNFSRERLDTLELYPFKELIKKNVPSVMIGHMHIPVLDDTPHIASSVSKKIVTGLLVEELGYKGLIVTDGMGMQGVVKHFPNGEADVMAVEAGSDLVELSQNSARAIKKIEEAIASERISQEEIDRKVKRVLATKYWLNLDEYQPTKLEYLKVDLYRKEALELRDQLSEQVITVLNSRKGIEDFSNDESTVLIRIGTDETQQFEELLNEEVSDLKIYGVTKNTGDDELKSIIKEIQNYDQVIVAVHDPSQRPVLSLKLPERIMSFIDKIPAEQLNSILFTNPYVLDELKPIQKSASIIMAYQNDDFMQKAAAKALLKKIKTTGKLSVSINEAYQNGQGF